MRSAKAKEKKTGVDLKWNFELDGTCNKDPGKGPGTRDHILPYFSIDT